MSNNKLQLGLLLDSYDVPAWMVHSLARLVDCEYAEVSLIVLNGQRTVQNKKNGLYGLFNYFDEKAYLRGSRATEMKSLQGIFGNVDGIEVQLINDLNGGSFTTTDIDRVREKNLDILINVSFGGLHGRILTSARYGVWEYSWESDPFGFWEVMRGLPATTMSLRILEEPPCSRTIFRSSALTYPFSPARNRDRSLWKAASYLPRQIALLHLLGEKEYFARADKYDHSLDGLSGFRTATGNSSIGKVWMFIRFPFKVLREIVRRKVEQDAWLLMFTQDKDENLPFSAYKKLVPPKNTFWADPHVIRKGDDHYVFVEEFDSVAGKGHISVIKVDDSGDHTAPVKVLEKDYHLSFPFVFQWNDRYYMVPESAENKTIDLYECTEFPHQWEHKLCLMENVSAVDSSLLFHDGKWWLFTAMAENEGALPEVELFLFHTEDLFAPHWYPHPLNPLQSDARNSRPAGRIFSKDGKLFRPSQDCSQSYGYGFDLNEILLLSETEYEEKCVSSVRPGWDKGISATHTFGIEGNFKIIDAYTTRKRFLNN